MNPEQIRDIERRKEQFLRAIEPLVQKRVELAMMFTRYAITSKDNTVTVADFPPAVKAIDEAYKLQINVSQSSFFSNNTRETAQQKGRIP